MQGMGQRLLLKSTERKEGGGLLGERNADICMGMNRQVDYATKSVSAQ